MSQWLMASARRRKLRSHYAARVATCRSNRQRAAASLALRAAEWRSEDGTYAMAEKWQNQQILADALCKWWRYMAQQECENEM